MGSFPEFTNGKPKAAAGMKVTRGLRTQETQALCLAVQLTSYGTLVVKSLSSLDFRSCNVKWVS